MKYKLIVDENAEEEVIVIVHAPSAFTAKIEDLVNCSGTGGILGRKGGEIRKLKFKEIECITVIDRKVIAIDTYGNQYRIQERLRDLENELPHNFIRINKSTLANEESILRFDTAFSAGVDAIFKSGYKEYVSRRCFAQIRRRYENEKDNS